jgi:hypothetical protein
MTETLDIRPENLGAGYARAVEVTRSRPLDVLVITYRLGNIHMHRTARRRAKQPQREASEGAAFGEFHWNGAS